MRPSDSPADCRTHVRAHPRIFFRRRSVIARQANGCMEREEKVNETGRSQWYCILLSCAVHTTTNSINDEGGRLVYKVDGIRLNPSILL